MRKWVVKAGSKMVCEGGPLLLHAWMRQVAQLRKRHDVEVVWVTSGAIAWAVEHTHFKDDKRTLPQKQALSAIGQPLVMNQYELALRAENMLGAQVLLTAGDMRDPIRRRNLQNTLKQLARWKVVPVLNENDAIATEEIRFGDNDSLASQVAVMIKAERLVLLTDVDGLYDADPRKKPKAKLIPFRAKVTAADLTSAKGKNLSRVGTGGMYSKLLAARRAQQGGVVTHMVRGDVPGNLLAIAEGKPPGTQIGGRHGS